jgi:hypothetical protein
MAHPGHHINLAMPLSPICTQWKESLPVGLKCRSSKTEVRVVHPQVADLNNLNKLSRISNPSK